MKLIKVICILTACAALILSGCGLQNSKSLGSAAISIPTYDIKAPAAGKILGLISEKGERISKGQPLFAIEDTKLDKEVKDAAAQLAKAEADLKRMQQGTPTASVSGADISLAQANVAAAQQKAAKMNSLLSQGAVSRSQAQAAQAELARATAQLQAASQVVVSIKPASPEQIEAQKKLIEQLKAQHAALLQKQQENEAQSPCTGIITELKAANNATAQKEQTILQLKATDSCTLTLTVSSTQAKDLQKGQPVNIKAKDNPAPFVGQISAINGTQITITSDKKPEDLKDGAQVEVTLAG